MDPIARSHARPEAMGDVPGVCTLPLTRAVVQYRDVHELDHLGGRVEDIGMALVVDGRYAAAAEVVDLGSARTKMLDLSTELVVLDWAYEPTHEHVSDLLANAAASGEPTELRRYAFQLARRVLERVGFGPLTRPVLLRIGFRDLCRDLDLHEGTSIRVVIGSGRVVRAHLDCDGCALVFRTAFHRRDPLFERALLEAFPEARLRCLDVTSDGGSVEYCARFPLPASFGETRSVLAIARRGLGRMMARFEPDRYSALSGMARTFGDRETLSRLQLAGSSPVTDVALVAPAEPGLVASTVH